MAKSNGLNFNLPSVDDLFSTEEERAEARLEKVVNLSPSEISDFPNHPFKVRMDAAMQEMTESVKQYGVLVPALVRPKPEGGYEMVAGHRRKTAADLAGLAEIPCIVRQLTDDEATIIMVDSNLQREQILPSEKAFAYKMKLDAMKRQAGRPRKDNSAPVGPNLIGTRSNLELAAESPDSKTQIQRYIRLTHLIPEILELADNSVLKDPDMLQIALRPAVELSYLRKEEQADLFAIMDEMDCTPSHAQAIKMRRMSEAKTGDERLSMDAMADFLRQAARDNGIPLTNAAVVLPSTEVFTRELTMPAMTEQQLRYNLPYEFRDFLTDEKSKYYFDYSMRDILRDQDGYPTEMTLLACAMLKETAERYRAMMRRAGFKLQVLTPSECAYAGVLAAYYRRTGLPQRDMCIVNLGYTAAYLYIYRGAFFESRREIDLGLNRLEQLVAEHCGVDIHVAHSYVLQNYNDVLSSDYAQSFYARIAVEVMKAVNFFNYNNRQQELTDLCLCSGGCNIIPLRQALAETTHLHLHTAQELLGDDVTLDEPWMYLRAIGGVDEGLRGGLQ